MTWDFLSHPAFSLAEFVLVLGAAVAAIMATYEARRSRIAAEASLQPPTPEVLAFLIPGMAGGEAEAALVVTIRNRADMAFTIEEVHTTMPGFEVSDTDGMEMLHIHFDALRPGSKDTERTIPISLRCSGTPGEEGSIRLLLKWSSGTTQPTPSSVITYIPTTTEPSS